MKVKEGESEEESATHTTTTTNMDTTGLSLYSLSGSNIGLDLTADDTFGDLKNRQDAIQTGIRSLKEMHADLAEKDKLPRSMDLTAAMVEFEENRSLVIVDLQRWSESCLQALLSNIDDKSKIRARKCAKMLVTFKKALQEIRPWSWKNDDDTAWEDEDEEAWLRKYDDFKELEVRIAAEMEKKGSLKNRLRSATSTIRGIVTPKKDDHTKTTPSSDQVKGGAKLKTRARKNDGKDEYSDEKSPLKPRGTSTPERPPKKEETKPESVPKENENEDDDVLLLASVSNELAEKLEETKRRMEEKEKEMQEAKTKTERLRAEKKKEEEKKTKEQALEKRRKEAAKVEKLVKEMEGKIKELEEMKKKSEEEWERLMDGGSESEKGAVGGVEELGGKKETDGDGDDEDDGWTKIVNKRKAKKNKKGKKRPASSLGESSSSSSSSSTESSSDESEDDKSIKKSIRQIQMEQLTRARMAEARPKEEMHKYGDDGKVDYKALKNKFMSMINVKGINYVDVLNEMPYWFRGAPGRMVEAFQGADNPKKAVEEAWKQLDGFFELRIQTAAERIRPIVSTGKIDKNDLEAHLNLLADLGGIRSHAKIAGVEAHLDRDDIVREVVMAKIPYAADEFYSKEAKAKKKKNSTFRFTFDHIIEKVEERAQVLKAQGKTVTHKSQTAKVAATATMPATVQSKSYGGALKNSPPKQQQPLRQAASAPRETTPKQQQCNYCNAKHQTSECGKLKQISVDARINELKRKGLCFRCLEGGHLARDCQQTTVRCDECNGRHQTILHRTTEQQQQTRDERHATRQNEESRSSENGEATQSA